MNKKLLSVGVTIIMVFSLLLAIPASAIPVSPPPQPVQAWNWTTAGDVTDIAVGDLNKYGKDDVVAIDVLSGEINTMHAITRLLNTLAVYHKNHPGCLILSPCEYVYAYLPNHSFAGKIAGYLIWRTK